MRTALCFCLASLMVASIGCSEDKFKYPLPIAGDYPEWVYKGSGSYEEDGKPILVGVGQVSGIRNIPLAKSSASNRARSEIAKILEVYSASLMKDYMASTTAGDMKALSEEQHVEQAIKTFSAATMQGVTISDFWVGPDGQAFARAKLDFSLLPDLAKHAELDEKVRDFVRDNAKKSFDALDKQEACHKVPGAPAKPAVDILFVIDDSGSMAEEQTNIATNFNNFFGVITKSGLDFHVGIVTTDVDYESKAGKFQGTIKVLKPDTPELENVFKATIAVGTMGSGREQGLEAIRLALSSPTLETHNAGFLRDGARLAVIIVSDENDQSPLPISQYTQFLSTLKGGYKRVTFAALVGAPGGCRSANGMAQGGERYIEAAKTFGKYAVVESICQDDFAKALAAISGEITDASAHCGGS